LITAVHCGIMYVGGDSNGQKEGYGQRNLVAKQEGIY